MRRFLDVNIAILLILLILISNFAACSKQQIQEVVPENEPLFSGEFTSSIVSFDNEAIDFYSEEFSQEFEEYILGQYSESIDSVSVSVLTPEEYNETQLILDSGQALQIEKIIPDVAIGAGAIIVTCVVLPALAPGLAPSVAVIVTDVLVGAAIDAAISGVLEYAESGDLKSAAFRAIEGAADGIKWGVIFGPVTTVFSKIRLLKKVQYADNLVQHADEATRYADNVLVDFSDSSGQFRSRRNVAESGTDNGFSQARRTKAFFARSAQEADDAFRGVSGKVWRELTEAQKDALNFYTGNGFGIINDTLRGINQTGIKTGHYQPDQVKGLIDNMTESINKSSYNRDISLSRKVDYQGMDDFFGVNLQSISNEELAALVNTTPIEKGFFSTSAVPKKTAPWFENHPIVLNVSAPAGTKMMYTAPFSKVGRGAGRSWDGITSQLVFSDEVEMLLQRGTMFRVTKAKRSFGKLFIDLIVIGQGY